MTTKEVINKVKHCGVEEIRLAMEQIEKDLDMLNFIKEKKVDFGWLLHCNQCHPGKIVAIKDHYNLGCNSNNNERMNESEIKYLLDWLL